MVRKLGSFSKRVLVAYATQRAATVADLERIEREMGSPVDVRAVNCAACRDQGVLLTMRNAGWCTCAAAVKLQRKEPDFVQRWISLRRASVSIYRSDSEAADADQG